MENEVLAYFYALNVNLLSIHFLLSVLTYVSFVVALGVSLGHTYLVYVCVYVAVRRN